ncbi:GLPGLI family protein [Chitinophaga costaii]|uniref:GLPGLI family protein n=1 Tax=Chitinophaga costaii TaxID=1335309 RepID=A0A1C3YP21_9BACT|nr:GLPGLI family protein [Chitinophaga costaii]PUZ30027.1 GLPGLI family protein [Chitinophaga costaii]SCB71801.1 GLPGLI family protein [Chitinophaga costaii]
MRYLLLLTVLPMLHWPVAQAQSLRAQYAIVSTIDVGPAGGDSPMQSISFTGYLYKKGSRYIYFEKPEYLKDRPDGQFVANTTANTGYSFNLNTDTIQSIYYSDFDSLIYRYRIDQLSTLPNRVQNFNPNYYHWDFLTDTKEINGLHCQKATLTLRGNLQWVLWFCPDIPMQAGIGNIKGVPGLIVEAERMSDHKHYTLDSYDANAVVPDSIFWPKEFNEPFSKPPALRSGKENDRISKKQELLKQ